MKIGEIFSFAVFSAIAFLFAAGTGTEQLELIGQLVESEPAMYGALIGVWLPLLTLGIVINCIVHCKISLSLIIKPLFMSLYISSSMVFGFFYGYRNLLYWYPPEPMSQTSYVLGNFTGAIVAHFVIISILYVLGELIVARPMKMKNQEMEIDWQFGDK